MDHNCLCLWVRWWWWSTPPPSPSSLCPQINPGTQNSETKRPFWKNAQRSRRGPSRNADRRPPPQPPQWTVCQTIVQLGAKLEDHWLSFPVYKGMNNRLAKLFKLNQEISLISLPTAFERESRPELLFGCLLIYQRTDRAARSSWNIPLTPSPFICFLLQPPILT